MLEAHSRLWESGKLARHHDVRSTAVLGVAILLCLVLGCSSPPPELRVLETPGLKHGAITGLRFRSEDVGDGALLLTTRNEDTPTSLDDAVYAYDPARGILSLATVDAWNDATGEVGDWCAMVRGIASPPPRLRRRKRKLAADGRTLDTAGNVVLTFGPSPQQNYLAVLSAKDRWRFPPIFPSLGGGPGPPSGQHYHELFTIPELRRVGSAVPLAITADSALQTCWSPDERFVIYSDLEVKKIVIVRRDKQGN